MKLKDNVTLSIAETVSDVLEGKVKEEGKYPHDMFHPETGKKEVAKDEAEHKALADKGYTHEKPEVDEVAEPKAKGEKEFKAKHTVKKSGAKEDGSIVKEANWMDDEPYSKNAVSDLLKAAKKDAGKLKSEDDFNDWMADKGYPIMMKHHKPGPFHKGKKTDFVKDSDSDLFDRYKKDIVKSLRLKLESVEEAKSKFSKSLLKKATDLALKMGGNMTGAVNKIEKMKKGLSDDPEVKAALQMANEEVTEEVVAEAHAMNKVKSKMAEDKERYQKFFKAALKKFGVTSPGELEGEKKKEFFNYVDKNYEADNETDKDESVKESTIAEAQIRTSFEADEMKNVGGDKAAKKMGIRVSFKRGKGDNMMGGDLGIFTGDEKKLVKYFQDFMGFEGKTFKELQKEYN
jgi:hypothetical protein